MRKIAVTTLALGAGLAFALATQGDPAHADGAYHSPYSVQFNTPVADLLADIDRAERGNPERESSVPHREWDSERVRRHYGGWGPPARHYPAAEHALEQSAEWKRERTIAVALRFIGYGYQHHHIPDWEPPRQWPWKTTCVGHNGKGVDCSNFTSFVFNLGFGIKPNSDVSAQAKLESFPGPGAGRHTPVKHIALPKKYEDFAQTLRTGDLLYIRNNRGKLAHVVLWVGNVGRGPDKTPLIIDSHGGEVKDSNGVNIPCGIHLRPFRDDSWYHHSADHAIRVWTD